MAALGLCPGNIVLLWYVSTTIDLDVLCILWIFTVDVPFMEKPGCYFGLTKFVKNTVGRVIF